TTVGSDVGILPTGGLTGFTGFNGMALDAIAPTAAQLAANQSTRMVIAGGTNTTITTGAIYESNNVGTAANSNAINWTQITTQTGTGFVAGGVMAYGGRRNGTDNPDVLYVASGNQIFLRTMSGGTLNATSALPAGAGNIVAIALDPNDWQTAFVTDGLRVYMTTDMGSTWNNVTGTGATALNNSPALIPRMGVRLAVIHTASGVDAVLLGDTNGVRRMLTNALSRWSTFGAGLPNAVVGGMQYNAADDVLVVGTFGRGAWEVSSASTSAFSPGVLQINGDTDFAGENDT